ncbi:phosphotransferase [Salinibacter sp. 10B]|uniref:phosphotransferase n=1 Tax=Salinibacter sp. 10B TaxID=1923971 RepID=UPI002157D2C5|nr:phosphotransferase [Salinibacter sp. 10B]
MTDDDVLPYLQAHLPDFTPTGDPAQLPDGNLNIVWRVPGTDRPVIVKYAPPYIAADPDTPLDPSRLDIEARCLNALDSGQLATLTSAHVRTPRLLAATQDPHVILMEDLGDLPTLDRWLRGSDACSVEATAPILGQHLGTFIGRLHATTHNCPEYAETFDNRPMQETRLAVQYRGVAEMLKMGGVDDAEALGARAEALGDALLETGECLTMGDLWPSSVLVQEKGLRLIDWELAHYGRPLQDVAHLRAHLWMQAHQAPSAAVADAMASLWDAFLTAYRDALGEADSTLWTDQEKRDAAVHFGAEILVRAVGPFQDGYVYAGLPPGHPAVQEALSKAARTLRSPNAFELRIDSLPTGNH